MTTGESSVPAGHPGDRTRGASQFPDVVGRDRELATIQHFMDGLDAGPGMLLIEGDAGIGKTTIWREGIESAARAGFVVLSARASQAETRLSYAGMGDLLEEVIDQTLPRIPPPQGRALAYATLKREPRGRGPDQRTVAVAFLSVVRVLAATTPVLIAIDDIQWLDPPSTRVLGFAARRVRDESVGILASVRIGLGPDPPLALSDPTVRDRLARLRVGAMSVGAIGQVIRNRFPVDLSRRTLLKVHETSRGNPLFALELAREITCRGTSVRSGEPLPVSEGLRELLLDQIRRQPTEVRDVLLLASLLARPTAATLKRAAGSESPASLDRSIKAGILVAEGEEIRLRHPLLASAIWADTPSERRRIAHRRLARVVADPEERARHLAFAAARPDERVASALEEASLRARSRGAPDAAAELADHASRLTPAHRAGDGLRRTILAAECRFAAGDMSDARAILEHAIQSMPVGPARADALRLLGRVRYHADSARAARDLASQALEQAGCDSALRAAVELDLAASSSLCGDQLQAAHHAAVAVDLADRHGTHDILAMALGLTFFYRGLAGEPPDRSMIERAVELEKRAEGVHPAYSPTLLSGLLLQWEGDLAEARSRMEATRDRVLEAGDESSLPIVLYLLSDLELLTGNWDTATCYAEQSCSIASRTGQRPYLAMALAAMAMVEVHRGQVEAARAIVREGMALADQTGAMPAMALHLRATGFLELSLGRPAEAHRHLGPLAEAVAAMGIGEPYAIAFLPDEIEALIALGEIEGAQALLEPLERRAAELRRPWALGTSSRCRGLLLGATGETGAALDVLDAALEHLEHLGAPLEVGRTLLVKGQIHRRSRGKGLARETLDQATRIFTDLGALLWAETSAGELGRAVLRPSAPLELTPTEERVAKMAASGMTNREVARALFVSPKTVEANLARVYRKLGIRSRAELGARIGAPSHG